MKLTFKTKKSVDEVIEDIQKILPNYSFGLQHIHNPPQKMREKGIQFNQECKILDICSPKIAYEFLSKDISLSCVMPCKIAVYKDKDETTITLNSIVKLIDDLNPDLIDIAQNAQDSMINIIKDSL